MAIAEEQQCLIEEGQLRLPTPQTSAVESASETENYGGTRPKHTQRLQSGPHKWKVIKPVRLARIRKLKHVLHC